MKVLLDANAYSLLMRGHAQGRGEQQRRLEFSLRRWAVLRGFVAAGMMGENDSFRVVNQRTLIHNSSSD